jgi:hypothetical protein
VILKIKGMIITAVIVYPKEINPIQLDKAINIKSIKI